MDRMNLIEVVGTCCIMGHRKDVSVEDAHTNWTKCSREVATKVLANLVLYSMGDISSSELSVLNDKYMTRRASKLLRLESVQREALARLKLFTIACAKSDMTKQDYKQYELPPIAGDVFGQFSPAQVSMIAAHDTASLHQLRRTVETVCRDTTKYVKWMVWSKLRFIVQGNNLHSTDLETPLMCRSIQAVYMSYPKCQDGLYLVNKSKQAIHNNAMNLIRYYTSDKRIRVKAEGDKFTNSVCNIDEVAECLAGTDEANDNVLIDQLGNLYGSLSNAIVSMLSGTHVELDSTYPSFNSKPLATKITMMAKILDVETSDVSTVVNKIKLELTQA